MKKQRPSEDPGGQISSTPRLCDRSFLLSDAHATRRASARDKRRSAYTGDRPHS
mgnify:CR=1 FL=1